jgi:chromosome segregation ATPase
VNLRGALFIAALVDYDNRRRNYEEFRERLEGHIDRWEGQISTLEVKLEKSIQNNERNKERLGKAKAFLDQLSSPQSIDWLERQKRNMLSHRSEEVISAASDKIAQHEQKVQSVTEQIETLERWINEGYERVRSITDLISTLESKISSAKSKL